MPSVESSSGGIAMSGFGMRCFLEHISQGVLGTKGRKEKITRKYAETGDGKEANGYRRVGGEKREDGWPKAAATK
jgi:hypothetical protein